MYANDTPLPDWLTPIDGAAGHYIADPDGFYPVILKFMGLKPTAATRFDIETANGVAKKMAQWHSKRCKHGWCSNLFIRGDDGRKAKWAVATFPVGDKPDISSPLATGQRNAAVRAVWTRLMG